MMVQIPEAQRWLIIIIERIGLRHIGHVKSSVGQTGKDWIDLSHVCVCLALT